MQSHVIQHVSCSMLTGTSAVRSPIDRILIIPSTFILSGQQLGNGCHAERVDGATPGDAHRTPFTTPYGLRMQNQSMAGFHMNPLTLIIECHPFSTKIHLEAEHWVKCIDTKIVRSS